LFKFFKLESAQRIIEIASSVYGFEVMVKTRGRYNGGTWVVKELLLKYVMFISPRSEFAALSEMPIEDKINDINLAIEASKADRLEAIATKLESGALSSIEQLLNIKLERQFKVDMYRIDGYHKESNTAYEIDEPQHFVNGELREECKERQAYIESKLKCKFVRIKV
jgi:very-short-patch-repair endonuclease